MRGSRGVARLLDRHKSSLSRAVERTGLLSRLTEKGVLTGEEAAAIRADATGSSGSLLVEVFSRKGLDAFRELYVTLEVESPHLLTSLLLDSQGEFECGVCQRDRRFAKFLNAFIMHPAPSMTNWRGKGCLSGLCI